MENVSNTTAETQTVWLCRHGNRIDFVDRTWKGTDPHLSDDGIIQARETGARLRGEGIRHIFASPFFRTVETAYQIAEALDLSIKVEHGACEWMNPEWFPTPPPFVPLEKLNERFPRIDLNYKSMVYPGHPEIFDDVKVRCRETARLLLDAYGSDILIIGHGASVDCLALGLLGCDYDVSSGLCALTKFVGRNGRGVLELNGDTSHLSGGEAHRDRFN